MFDITEKDILFKVQKYELHRTDIHFCIDILETIAGSSGHKFQAIPGDGIKIATNKDFLGFGDTANAALEDCLSKTKNKAAKTIQDNFCDRPTVEFLKDISKLV